MDRTVHVSKDNILCVIHWLMSIIVKDDKYHTAVFITGQDLYLRSIGV